MTLDPSNRDIVDDVTTPPLDFAYVVSCRPSVFIYQSAQRICAEVYRPTQFGQQFEYRQQLPKIVDSCFLVKTPFIRANICWREWMCRLIGSSLEVLARHLVWNVTALYA